LTWRHRLGSTGTVRSEYSMLARRFSSRGYFGGTRRCAQAGLGCRWQSLLAVLMLSVAAAHLVILSQQSFRLDSARSRSPTRQH
jgi:hypothetical protein